METELGARLGPSEQAFPSVNAHRTPDGCVAQPWRSLLSRTVPCTGGSTRPRSQPTDVSNASPLLCDRETPPTFPKHTEEDARLSGTSPGFTGLKSKRPGKPETRKIFSPQGRFYCNWHFRSASPGSDSSSGAGTELPDRRPVLEGPGRR